ncbi:acetyl-CoA C-acetyltransferase [Erysipelothrix urinaevulpis]|uniref:acetyl-CoA C-acetyltransferase n=1 Tax=Erysipelothrix urinaevulpis TaxID=2683717 RepID=UPI00135861B5|nr:acetyl-CoA C-acetyltransferase [Erysipelothrix urinaevulpis]
MREVVIVSAVRTPIATFNGSFAKLSAVDLGEIAVRSAIEKINLDKNKIDEVVIGNVLQAGLGQNPARQIAIKANIPVTVPSYTVNKVCGSGLKAIHLGAQSILLGDAEIVVAGGTESMSQAPYLLPHARTGLRMGNKEVVDTIIHDGLTDAFSHQHMGLTAEKLADKFGLTRHDLDDYALISQSRAEKAIKSGRFTDEIIPVKLNDNTIIDHDEHPRFGMTKEKLERLKPVFKKDGLVTAGNASGINDGAAAVILMSAEKAKELELPVLAKIVSFGTAGVEPEWMGLGPIPATKKALEKAKWSMEDIDLIEINESFSAQALAVIEEFDVDINKVNVNGGAIALGHPIGASGSRVVVSLVHELIKQDKHKGLATLCIGGGQGITILIEKP